jgi:hypothetical protein
MAMNIQNHSEAANGVFQALIITTVALFSVLALLGTVAPIV